MTQRRLVSIKRLDAVGDTIIEVLLAILVVSTVLAGAYASSTNSLSGTRQAEERGEALKLAEGQIEQLKGNAAAAIAMGNLFCVSTTATPAVPVVATNPTQSVSSPQSLANDPLNQYLAACKSSGIPYNLSITRTGDNTNGYVFSVYVRWFRAGNSGSKDEVRLIYRLYP